MDPFTFTDVIDANIKQVYSDIQPLSGEVDGTLLTLSLSGSNPGVSATAFMTNDNWASFVTDGGSLTMQAGLTFVQAVNAGATAPNSNNNTVVIITPAVNPAESDTFSITTAAQTEENLVSSDYRALYVRDSAKFIDMEKGTLGWTDDVNGSVHSADRLGSLSRITGSTDVAASDAGFYESAQTTSDTNLTVSDYSGPDAQSIIIIGKFNLSQFTGAGNKAYLGFFNSSSIVALILTTTGIEFNVDSPFNVYLVTEGPDTIWTDPPINTPQLIGNAEAADGDFVFGFRYEIASTDQIQTTGYSPDLSIALQSRVDTLTALGVTSLGDLQTKSIPSYSLPGAPGRGVRSFGIYYETNVSEVDFQALVDEMSTDWATRRPRLTKLTSKISNGYPTSFTQNTPVTLAASGKFKNSDGVTNTNKTYTSGVWVSDIGEERFLISSAVVTDGDAILEGTSIGCTTGVSGKLTLLDDNGNVAQTGYDVVLDYNFPILPSAPIGV